MHNHNDRRQTDTSAHTTTTDDTDNQHPKWQATGTLGIETSDGDDNLIRCNCGGGDLTDFKKLNVDIVARNAEIKRRHDDAIAMGYAHKTWKISPRNKRETHARLNGKTIPIGELFQVGSGQASYPTDENAPGEERFNCRCWVNYEFPAFNKCQSMKKAMEFLGVQINDDFLRLDVLHTEMLAISAEISRELKTAITLELASLVASLTIDIVSFKAAPVASVASAANSVLSTAISIHRKGKALPHKWRARTQIHTKLIIDRVKLIHRAQKRITELAKDYEKKNCSKIPPDMIMSFSS